jgi:hypothetical protein
MSAMLGVWPTVSAAQPAPQRTMMGLALQSYSISADAVDGTLPAAGVGAIIAINPLLDFEAEFLRPVGTVRRQYTGISFSFATLGASREEIEREGVLTRTTNERSVAGLLSLGAAFHPRPTSSRFQPRVFVGVTTHFVRNRSLRDPLQWPASVTLERVLRMQPPIEEHRSALGSLTLGFALAIDVTERLVLMPELRYDFGSIGDEINNAWRTGARVLWRF